jgi:hypothetical protein
LPVSWRRAEKGAPRAARRKTKHSARSFQAISEGGVSCDSHEASTDFSEACTAYFADIENRCGRFRAFPQRCLALDSQFVAMPARYEFADPLTLHFRSPDILVPPQWP